MHSASTVLLLVLLLLLLLNCSCQQVLISCLSQCSKTQSPSTEAHSDCCTAAGS
jgi:hypothetical protein